MSLRILLADESSMIKKAFELGLTSYDAEIKNVQHGIDVQEVAESFKPDIIFADVLINKMNGYEVCSLIKQHETLSSTPVVLMWSGFMDIDEDKYFTSQADGKLEKPFSADQLLKIIEDLSSKLLSEKDYGYYQDETAPKVDKAVAEVSTKKTTPADDLLFKEDIKNESQEDEDIDEEDHRSAEESDEIDIDGFEAVDLNDNLIEDFSMKNGLFDEMADDKEPTQIPTLEQEEELFKKLKEDTAIRNGYNLSSDLEDLTAGDLSDDLLDDGEYIDLDSNLDENLSVDLNNSFDDDLDDIQEIQLENKTENNEYKTILRDIDHYDDKTDDNRSADAGMTDTSSITAEKASSPTGLNALSKEEIKKIVKEQAKEMIESIIWEMIPEMSKQMIEKEIKRLLAEEGSDSTPPATSL